MYVVILLFLASTTYCLILFHIKALQIFQSKIVKSIALFCSELKYFIDSFTFLQVSIKFSL